jgi:peptidyl-prolyl cis-trans isomerase SDCCAG10
MSSTYNLEPPPTAKVLLQTTAGDILLELFAKQTPLASRNFLQHCLDGYYNGTIFHRVVSKFIVQGGDTTGTGFGGESIYDNEPFADEFHTRLKFNRRGLLGMANSGGANENGSQFFLTLGPTPELGGKNTMFGRVVGDTIFNVMKMGDAEMTEEGSERPLYPEKITGTEILVNPFEDMDKRELVARVKDTEKEKVQKKKPKRKAGKNLLSFGGDEEEGTAPVVKKPRFNPKAVSGGPELPTEPKPAKKEKKAKPPQETEPEPLQQQDEEIEPKKETIHPKANPLRSPSPPPVKLSKRERHDKAQAEIERLKASLKRAGPATEKVEEKPLSALEAMIPATSKRGRKRGAAQTTNSREEDRTMALFKAFKSKLDTAEPADPIKAESAEPTVGKKTNGAQEDDEDEEAALCDLHFIINCQSCGGWVQGDAEEDDDGEGWLNHRLTFEKDRLGKDLEWKRKNEEELIVVDPLEKARELGVEKVAKSKDRKGRRDREWDKPRDSKTAKK